MRGPKRRGSHGTHACRAAEESLCLQSDVAMVFSEGGKLSWHIGRVQRMLKHTGKATVEWKHPVSLEPMPTNLKLACRWYTRSSRSRGGCWFNYDCDDSTPFDCSSLMCTVHLDWRPGRGMYELAESERGLLDDLCASFTRTRAPSDAARRKVASSARNH